MSQFLFIVLAALQIKNIYLLLQTNIFLLSHMFSLLLRSGRKEKGNLSGTVFGFMWRIKIKCRYVFERQDEWAEAV